VVSAFAVSAGFQRQSSPGSNVLKLCLVLGYFDATEVNPIVHVDVHPSPEASVNETIRLVVAQFEFYLHQIGRKMPSREKLDGPTR
jgi:hypothetical protein